MSPFQIRTEDLDGPIQLVAIEGELDLATAEPFDAALRRARMENGAPILLDLGDCEFLDSTALAVIVNAWRECSIDRKRIVISGCTGQVRRVVAVTQLRQEIAIFDSREEAIEQLRAAG